MVRPTNLIIWRSIGLLFLQTEALLVYVTRRLLLSITMYRMHIGLGILNARRSHLVKEDEPWLQVGSLIKVFNQERISSLRYAVASVGCLDHTLRVSRASRLYWPSDSFALARHPSASVRVASRSSSLPQPPFHLSSP